MPTPRSCAATYGVCSDYGVCAVTYGVCAVTYGVCAVTYGVCAVTYGVCAVTYGVCAVTYGVCAVTYGVCAVTYGVCAVTYGSARCVLPISRSERCSTHVHRTRARWASSRVDCALRDTRGDLERHSPSLFD